MHGHAEIGLWRRRAAGYRGGEDVRQGAVVGSVEERPVEKVMEKVHSMGCDRCALGVRAHGGDADGCRGVKRR